MSWELGVAQSAELGGILQEVGLRLAMVAMMRTHIKKDMVLNC